MEPVLPEPIRERLAAVSARHGVDWLALHGSRATGQSHVRSDWDFAFEALERPVDPLALRADLVDVLGTDNLDLSSARPSSALFRFRVARDGLLLHERAPGLWSKFRELAVRTWCDMEPVLRPAFEARLARWRERGV